MKPRHLAELAPRRALVLLMGLALCIFACEWTTMMVLARWGHLSHMLSAVLDAGVLIGMLVPFLYVLVLRPMQVGLANARLARDCAEIGARILRPLGERGDLESALGDLVRELKERTGLDSVGVRVMGPDGQPIVAWLGPDGQPAGEACRIWERGVDGAGRGEGLAQCLCDRVLMGSAGSAPGSTMRGSVWTNGVGSGRGLRPVESGPSGERICVRTGYASVALVPVGDSEHPRGLLHAADRRRGRLSALAVELLEGIASHVASALLRSEAERRLVESEARHRRIFEGSRDALMTLEPPDWGFTSANEATLGMFGVASLEEFLALGPADVSPERQSNGALSSERAGEVIGTALEQGSHYFEWTHRRLGGEEFPATVLLTRVEIGGRTLLQATVREVAAQKEAEEALRASEAKYRLLIDTANEAVVVAQDAQLRFVNQSLVRLLGWEREEDLIGRPIFDIIHPDYRGMVAENYRRRMLGERLEPRYTFEVLARDGSTRTVEISATLTDWQGRPATLNVLTDITSQVEARAALAQSEARLRSITDAAQDAILMMDDSGLITYWNPAAVRILGYSGEEAIGRRLHDLIVPETYRPAHYQAFPLFQSTGTGRAIGRTLELEALRKDGRQIPVEVSLSSVQIEGRWHAVGVMRDIEARKRAEREILEANHLLEAATVRANELAGQAEAASVAKSEFLANMSHEIRTPMNGVIGMAGLLMDTGLDAEQRRYAEALLGSGEALLGLINDILDFSKIEAGKLELDTVDFDLHQTLEGVATGLAVRAEEKGLELLWTIEPGTPTALRGDAGRLRQVLTNLAGNAVKFTGSGEVVVRASLERETGDEAFLRFSVRDTGIGIPVEKLPLIFGKFTQADTSTTREYGGTGLGLAICQQLVNLMGGEIDVESREGAGSEFWFTCRMAKRAATAPAEGGDGGDLAGVRTLIVDDNATNREILMARTTGWGMRPAEVSGGAAALDALAAGVAEGDPYLLAIVDMQMPAMDGVELGRRIRADRGLDGLRMVMLTSMGTDGDGQRYLDQGFSGYAAKPIRPQELRTALRRALGGMAVGGDGARAPRAEAAVEPVAGAYAGRGARILVAEDNLTNQQVALGILKRLGLEADLARNGREAVAALEAQRYDLVLMDVQMPEMDGLEATRCIRSADEMALNRGVPIVAMTAHAMVGDRERCLGAGMDGYLTKPVSRQALAEALARWMPGPPAGAVAAPPPAPSPPAAESDAPVFDRAGMLDRLMGDEELAAEVIACFAADLPGQVATLAERISAGDAPGATRAAHSIKGAAGNVGGVALARTAAALERLARDGDLAGAGAGVAGLRVAADVLVVALGAEGPLQAGPVVG